MSSQVSSLNTFNIKQDNTSAIVSKVEDAGYQIRIGEDYFQAKKAFSCLIKPLVDDVVQVIVMEDDIFILNILERRQTSITNLQLPEHTEVSAAGSITLAASEISHNTLNYNLTAETSNVTTEIFNLLTEELYQYSEFNHVKTQQLLKEVQEFEQSVTQQLRMIVNDHWRVDSQTIHMLSEEDVTIDARSVSLG